MKRVIPITTLFLDIGDVLLTDGWDHQARKRAATTFKLNALMDAFVSSCSVRIRKPDAAIFRLALDIAQVPARQIVYIDNTAMSVPIAETFGDSEHSSHRFRVNARETGRVRTKH